MKFLTCFVSYLPINMSQCHTILQNSTWQNCSQDLLLSCSRFLSISALEEFLRTYGGLSFWAGLSSKIQISWQNHLFLDEVDSSLLFSSSAFGAIILTLHPLLCLALHFFMPFSLDFSFEFSFPMPSDLLAFSVILLFLLCWLAELTITIDCTVRP